MIPEAHSRTVKEWFAWFEKNHEKYNKVHLISHKKHTGKSCISHRESMNVAICFGWIDTVVKRIDDNTYRRTFVKRTDKSRWSKSTLSYANKLIKKKLMTPVGMKRYKEGLLKPTIDHNLPKNPKIPTSLKKLLDNNKKAKENFEKFSPSVKRYFIWWILKAKKEETINKRVKNVFEKIKKGEKY